MPIGTPVMGIELLGCRPQWTSPLCEVETSGRSVYQMTASRGQARGEGNCAKATELGMETCEWLGNLTSKSIDRFAVETVRKRARNLLVMKVPRSQAIRHGKSRRVPWHMAKTKTSGVSMTNAWLAVQGVLSLKSLLADLALLRGTARCEPAC
jgi:hypothetical protein